MRSLFNELVLVALDKRKELSRIPTKDEWQYLYVESVRQAISGVLLCGVEKLPKYQRPSSIVLYKWIGTVGQIESRNSLLNQRCIELQNLFAQGGFSTCILKGQGNALMYPEPLKRQSGDIDIWVDGRIRDIVSFLSTQCEKSLLTNAYHHTEFPIWNDVEVEVHWRPSWRSSPIHNYRLQRWFKENKEEQFANTDTSTGLHIPTWRFNVVYQLQHMFLHVLQEGLGLRQVMDYYYLLSSEDSEKDVTFEDTLKWLGLYGFAGAMMYVMKEVFCLNERYMVTPVDEKKGKFLLEEILQSGNFGKFDERNTELHKLTGISRSLARVKRSLRFLTEYPVEVLYAPFQIYHVIWRKLGLWRL